MLHRRDFFEAALAAGGVSLLSGVPSAASAAPGAASDATPGATSSADDQSAPAAEAIDTNVHLFHWPFRRLPLDATGALVAKLRALGIGQAWAGSFEGLLHRDIRGVNARLVEACADHAGLLPVGSINPALPGWEDDLRRCVDEHRMAAIRLHPNYHGYTLADACFRRLLHGAGEAGCLVQIAVAMEDPRTQHPLVRVPEVELAPLPDVLAGEPRATVQLLNARLRGPVLETLAPLDRVFLDTARIEGTDGVTDLLKIVPPARVALGTHAPFLIPEAALIRLAESQLAGEELRELQAGTAQRLLAEVRR